MYNIGDLVVYSSHGICKIDDVCDKTYAGITRTYYVIHPIEDEQLTISVPVNNNKGMIQSIVSRQEAEEILQTFTNPGTDWIEKSHDRIRTYNEAVKTGDRNKISKIINTLLRKKYEVEANGKKLGESERQMLLATQNILFKELSISLGKSYDSIVDEVYEMLKINA